MSTLPALKGLLEAFLHKLRFTTNPANTFHVLRRTEAIMTIRTWTLRAILNMLVLSALISAAGTCLADAIKVKYPQGVLRGFVVVRTEEGKKVGVGDLQQTVSGTRVTVKIALRLDDGSVFEDTSVFSQRAVFRLISDHFLEKGPAFKDPTEVWINCQTNQVRVLETKDRKDKETVTHVNLPADLANGIVPVLLENITDDVQHTLPMLATTPKPRIVKLIVAPEGEDTFSVEGAKYKARRYLEHIEIGGVAGAVAPLVGEKPPDCRSWILTGDTPLFLKSVGPLAAGTPVWEIELTSPTWKSSQ
jgi:hypothetical protein